MTPRGLRATAKVWTDPLDKSRGYIILAEARKTPTRRQTVLVAPIIYTSLARDRKYASDYVRYVNPLWVRSNITKSAVPTSLYFIRYIGPTKRQRSRSVERTFILEIQRRTEPYSRNLVLVDYRTAGRKVPLETELDLSVYESHEPLNLRFTI
ncbi:uncharacterized protein B0I36DRAFT_343101 [Microdochium trichocladiopsis]|uniref:Uncharacterized protein n=1 Tax=Microdochium trichocladiopsis TaxID=1682393 RepID=A0A9P8XP28_9PEZI|nr:uncharacterized protein B0I36DRAFT_343101 [Microdochium trichocladiopsis]KAH7007951.1 hypothetical protein B0I36DRAFT_343101 [Microdochium trichocladiopsis]